MQYSLTAAQTTAPQMLVQKNQNLYKTEYYHFYKREFVVGLLY